MTTTLMAVIDGTPVPLTDCFWVRFNADGCAYSSLHGDMAATAEQAHRDLIPRQRDRDRDARLGYTIQLLTREQWREQAQDCFYGHCTHRQTAKAGAA